MHPAEALTPVWKSGYLSVDTWLLLNAGIPRFWYEVTVAALLQWANEADPWLGLMYAPTRLPREWRFRVH